MSNNITAFVLGLKSTYEGEHMIFGLLSLLTSLKMMFSSSIYLLASDKISLFFVAE
jgi:hypothetical protein